MATKKAGEDKAKSNDKVFDVAKPGDSAASPTSRPVIVGHGTGLKQDPMVKTDDATSDESDDTTAPLLTDKKVIKPLTDSLETHEEEKEAKHSDTKEATAKEDQVAEQADDGETQKDEELKDEEDDAQTESAGDAAVDALAQEVNSKKESAKAEDAAKKKQVEIDKLVSEKKYIVPIGEEAHRKSHAALYLIILIIVLTLVFLNFAVDAGVIDIGVQPLTDVL